MPEPTTTVEQPRRPRSLFALLLRDRPSLLLLLLACWALLLKAVEARFRWRELHGLWLAALLFACAAALALHRTTTTRRLLASGREVMGEVDCRRSPYYPLGNRYRWVLTYSVDHRGYCHIRPLGGPTPGGPLALRIDPRDPRRWVAQGSLEGYRTSSALPTHGARRR